LAFLFSQLLTFFFCLPLGTLYCFLKYYLIALKLRFWARNLSEYWHVKLINFGNPCIVAKMYDSHFLELPFFKQARELLPNVLCSSLANIGCGAKGVVNADNQY
jgi:hypothetical protein